MVLLIAAGFCVSFALTMQYRCSLKLRREIIRHDELIRRDRKIFATFATGALEAIKLETECRKAECEAIRQAIEALPCQRKQA